MKRTLKKATAFLLIMLMSLSSAFMSFAETESEVPHSAETVAEVEEVVECIETEEMAEVVEAVEAVEADTEKILENETNTVKDNDTGSVLAEQNDEVLLSNGTGVTIHYDANGGEGEMPDDVVSVGSQYTIKYCGFTKSGHEMLYWIEVSDGMRRIHDPRSSFSILAGSSDITLKAFWICTAGIWNKDEKGWQFLDSDKEPITNDWAVSGENIFFLGEDGYIELGKMFSHNGDIFYAEEEGAILKNTWFRLKDLGNAYAREDGSIIHSQKQTIDGVEYTFDEQGLALDAIWIEFDTDGGYPVDPQIIIKGTKPVKPFDPFYRGRKFCGWYHSDLSREYDFTEPLQEDTTFIAEWEKNFGWINTDGKWIYLDTKGKISNEWRSSSDKLFFLGDDGYMVTDATINYDEKKVRVDETGALIRDCTDAENLYLEKWVDTSQGDVYDGVIFFDEDNQMLDFLDGPLCSTYARELDSRSVVYNSWVAYPAEYLSDSKYRTYGLAWFYYNRYGKKVCNDKIAWNNRIYKFDDNGVCLDDYLITYANDGTDEQSSIYYYYGDWITIKEYSKQRKGYTSIGYNTKPDGTGKAFAVGDKIRPIGVNSLYVQWKGNAHTVRFDVNGHGKALGEVSVLFDQKITKPEDPAENLYTFGGWYKEPSCINAWDFDNDLMPDEDIILYAKWIFTGNPSDDSDSTDTEMALEELEKIDPADMSQEDIARIIQDKITTKMLEKAMLNDEKILDELERLEQATGKKAVPATKDNFNGLDVSGVSIIGAALNKLKDSAKGIQLQIGKAGKEHSLPSQFRVEVAIQFSMDLDNVADTKALKVPVSIRIPLPASTKKPEQIVILHYDASGNYDMIHPSIFLGQDEKLYASFVVTGFSDFVFIEEKPQYVITVETDGHGTASASASKATEGETVALAYSAASGYVFDNWQVISGNVSVDGGNQLIMPAEDVNVKATFKALSSSGSETSTSGFSGGSSGGSSGGGGGGGAKGGGPGAAAAGTPTFSKNWFEAAAGIWMIKDKLGNPVTSAWLCDDAVAANGQSVWYLMNTDGTMLAAGLVQDNTGNYYSLEMNHNGYYGMLRYVNGTYDGIYMEFSQKHDGTFGAITNQSAIDALKAKYGVTKFGIGNDRCVYTKTFE